MTVKIVGHWERSWRSPIEEYDMWWHPLKEFGLNDFYMCPVTGIGITRCMERSSVDEVFAEVDDQIYTRVYVDENATTELSNFVHPENALYIMGKTSYSPYLTHYRDGQDQAVKISTVANSAGFWGEQATILILYDRYMKGLV